MENPRDILPKQFIERLTLLYGDKTDEILTSFSQKNPVTLRVNSLQTTVKELAEIFVRKKIFFDRVPWYEDAFILPNSDNRTLTDMDEYKNGFFYLQSLSSMIPALVLNPKENEYVLDIAAAPGSKTTQIAAMMQNTGKIVANDKSRQRMYKLRANLLQQKVSNVVFTTLPGQMLWKRYPQQFDKVLVDVPCTMEGRFYSCDSDTYKDWSLRKIKSLGQMQRYMLRSSISCTKPGGTIVYSTCTLAPEENEAVIDWILQKEQGTVEISEITLEIPDKHPGILEWKNKQFNPEVQKTVRILPSKEMEGFFVAKLRKAFTE